MSAQREAWHSPDWLAGIARERAGAADIAPPHGGPIDLAPVKAPGLAPPAASTSVPWQVLTDGARGEPVVRAGVGALDDRLLRPGERVLLSRMDPRAIVETTERCLARGLPVAVDVSDIPLLWRALGRRVGALDLVLLDSAPAPRSVRWALRARDILVSIGALAALAPLFLVLGVLIRLTSPGPMFHTAEVVGRDGQRFTWRKLRSMRPVSVEHECAWRQGRYHAYMNGMDGAGGIAGEMKKVLDVTRVTRIGAVLRKYSLDELPQLWNVLRGDMTLVGPRPSLPYEYEVFERWHRLRVSGITPGLTGPWQAYGRSRASFDEMILMDYCYGRCRSFWLDTRLILRTVVVMVTGEGGR